MKKGVELALDTVAADAGYGAELSVPIVDSGSDPEKAAELLTDLFGDGAIAAIGGATSAEAIAMIPVIDKYDRVLISPSASSPALTGASRSFYRIFPSDFRAATKLANFITQDLGYDKVVVIAEHQQAYAKGAQEVFKTEYERYGKPLLESIEFPPHTSDFSGIVERVMTLKPQAVYVIAFDVASGDIILALKRAGFAGTILATSAFATPSAIARVGEAAADVILTQTVFNLDSEHAHVRAFVEAYRKKFGEDPDLYAAHGYDAMMVLAQAMKGREPLPSEVPKGLREEFPGVTGAIRFDEKGDVQKYPRVYIVGDDLGLYDYDERVTKQKQEILDQRRELERRLEELRRQAAAGQG
jgi:branched-chain amino acid transport system substrate-binding protein